MQPKNLSIAPVSILVLLSLCWGANMAAIKIGAQDMGLIFMAAARSSIAALLIALWMRLKGVSLFPSAKVVWYGVGAGLLFGLEFALVYLSLGHTLASRAYVLLYSAPFWVALGAHFLFADDRLTTSKTTGLCVAFIGIIALFIGKLGELSFSTLYGDMLALLAGALWGATTLFIKKYLAKSAEPLQTLFFQLLFSAPILWLLSLLWGETWVKALTWSAGGSLFYQSVIVAFISYLVWFVLVHRYPVSLLQAFTMLTPVFGVFISGVWILGEPLTINLIIALVLVSLGLVLVNLPSTK